MPEVTDEYLAEVEARYAAATEGPWEIDYNETVGHIKSLADPDRHTPTVARYDIWFDGRVSDHFAESMGYTKEGEQANGVFIAHARLDVPTLVAEVRRLRGELREALKTAGQYAYESGGVQGVLMAIGWQGGVDATVEGFRAENERLRAEVARLTAKLEAK